MVVRTAVLETSDAIITARRGNRSPITPPMPSVATWASVLGVTWSLACATGAAAGTGMVLSSSGLVLTNNHVIRGATSIRVDVPGTGRSYVASVLGYSVTADVALLRLRGASGLHAVRLGNSSRLKVG